MDLRNQLDLLVGIYRELGTSSALAAAERLAAGDWEGAVRIPAPDPGLYGTPQAFYIDAQTSALLRKVKVDIPGIDRRQAAIDKWFEGEAECFRSNERLGYLNLPNIALDDREAALAEFFSAVRKVVSSWIGATPPCLDSLQGRYGPGATFSDKGRLTTVADKMTSSPTLTRGAFWYLLNWMGTSWAENIRATRRETEFVRGNRFTTVPKTALVDRSIAVEPAINLFYQLALGQVLRKRLRNATGWDLDSAQEVHRREAMNASVTLDRSTIDLSNASDTVSIELVRLCLPPAWFAALDELRSKETLLPDHVYRGQKRKGGWCVLEKFSSMGNGFTFELETILFAAIAEVYLEKVDPGKREGPPLIRGLNRTPAKTRLGKDLFVFGDDIILPDSLARGFCAVLSFCGFSVNKEKTFIGPVPFRESCGADFFRGVDVRPVFVKDLPYDEPWKAFPLVNAARRALLKIGNARKGVVSLGPWARYVECLPAILRRVRGPECLGDCVIHDSPDRWKVRYREQKGEILVLKLQGVHTPWVHWTEQVRLACHVYGLVDVSNGLMARDAKLIPHVAWTSYG